MPPANPSLAVPFVRYVQGSTPITSGERITRHLPDVPDSAILVDFSSRGSVRGTARRR
jgi:hypothetical protein